MKRRNLLATIAGFLVAPFSHKVVAFRMEGVLHPEARAELVRLIRKELTEGG